MLYVKFIQFGLMDVPDLDNMGLDGGGDSDGEDNSALEAELLALTGGGGGGRRKQPQRGRSPATCRLSLSHIIFFIFYYHMYYISSFPRHNFFYACTCLVIQVLHLLAHQPSNSVINHNHPS